MNSDRFFTAKLALVLLPILLTFGAKGAIAQITPANDGTGTRVTGTQQLNITGGTQAGNNLFHSFQQFGVNAGQTANFLSNPNTQNILGRVTGGNTSLINGLLQVSGSNANLYLINPSGIIFGKNASLNVPGSFTATTANGIGFGNGQWFNAIGSNNYSTLTSNPTSFGFIGSSGSLINAGNLSVNPGQSIALVGGTVVNTGTIAAPGGNITIAAIPGEKRVRIGQDGTVLSLDLPMSDRSFINAPITTPLALPELLTGGSIPSAMGVVVEDGVVRLTGGSGAIAGNLSADGTGVQNGGNVVAYADNSLNFSGMISAKGGELGGNGGFVDTSGKAQINIAPTAKVITTAAKGLTGNWVIDPVDLEVVAGAGGTIVAGNSDPAASTIGAGTIVSALNGTNVNLQAANSITVNAAIDASTNAASGNLTLTAPTATLNRAISLKAGAVLNGTATTVNVGANGTVQNGIDVASPTTAGTVNLAAATYKQGSPINITKNVTVRGLGLGSTIVSGNNQYRVFTINSGNVTLDQMSIVEGAGVNGGGIYNRGNLTISNSSVNNNNAASVSGGGGIANDGSLQILRSTIFDNLSANTGGIINSGTLTIEDSTLSGNRSNNTGAAILNGGTLTIRRSTLSGNRAAKGSGGIMSNYGSVTIENSTITGNTSGNNEPSGIYGDALLSISNSIVSGNSGANGVEIDPIYAFKFKSLGYNIFGQNSRTPVLSGSVRNPTDIIPTTSLNQIIAPLGDYGGPTKTHALLPGSIAIDRANPTNASLDQRGIDVQGAGRDIGAYESKGFALATTTLAQSKTVNTTFAAPLKVNVVETAFNKPLPVEGITIEFTTPTSIPNATLNNMTAITDRTGTAMAIATANIKVGTYTVRATAAEIRSKVDFALTNTADVAKSIVPTSGSGQTATVDRNFANNLVATVTDQFGNPVKDSIVTFSLPGLGMAGGVFVQNTAITDVNGIATIAIKANTKAGAFTTTGNFSGATTGADFNLINTADIANSIFSTSGSGQTATVDKNFSNNLVATVIDKFGNPVSNSTVTFSLIGTGGSGAIFQNTATTDGKGQVTIAVKANTKAGAFAVTGSIPGTASGTSFNLVNTADVANSIVSTSGSGQTAIVDRNFTNNLVATVKDKFGNPVKDSTVTFSLPGTGAAGGVFVQNTATTDVNGIATIAIKANTKAGAFTTTGNVSGVPTGANFDLINTADVANLIATTSGSGQTATVDRNFTNNLVATVTDQFGNPIKDSTVTFSLPGTGASGVFVQNTATTDVNGIATIAIKANTKAGAFTTTGTVPGITTGANFDLINTADSANSIATTSGSGQTATVDRNFTNNLVATVTDKFGNPVKDSTVTFSLPGTEASGVFVQNTATTDVNGIATIAIKANTKTGTFITTGTIANTATGADFNLINIADVANSIVTTSGSGQTATVDKNFTNNLVATVTDKFGNPVKDSTVTFSLPGTGASGVFVQNTVTTDVNGVATIAIKANTKAGTFTTTGNVSGVTTGANFNLISTADIANSIVTTNGSGQVSSSTIRTQVLDQFNNPIANQSVIFKLPTTGASGTFSNGNTSITLTTDANGIITTSLTTNNIPGDYNGTAQIPSGPITQFYLSNNEPKTKKPKTSSTLTERLYIGKKPLKHSPIVPTSDVLCADREGIKQLSKNDPYQGVPACVTQSATRGDR